MESPTPHLGLSDEAGVLTVTLNRPEKVNAISREMREGLAMAVTAFGERSDLRVMLIRAKGSYFSAGMDIGDMGRTPDNGVELRYDYRRLHRLFDEMEAIEKPIVVAVHAACLGGALEMALSCDFRLASDVASFALPEIAIGVLPGSGGTSRLTQLVGRGWARWMVMANQSVDAGGALQMGLIQAVYPAGDFDVRVDDFVRQLLAMPSEVMGLAKVAIDLSASTDRGSARWVERVANTILMKGEDHRAAVQRFKDRSRK